MRVPTFSRFCFCLNLQTGNTICAWMFLLAYIAIFLIALFSLVFGIDIIHIDQFRVTETLQNVTLVQEEVQEVKETRIGVGRHNLKHMVSYLKNLDSNLKNCNPNLKLYILTSKFYILASQF
ncbi:hypothetical protein ACKWTF_014574 [Chironomus riparius]